MKTDFEIQKDVMDELKWEPFLSSSEISVAVKNGVVTLSGTVSSYAKKTIAENATKRVSGVKAVAEDIEVKPTDSLFKNDSELAQAILSALKWHSAVNEERIKIKVEDGVVTMDGEVEWEYQKTSALAQVQNISGVRRIINNITIKPGLIAKDLKQKISAAFHRSAALDSNRIDINVTGHKVILSGKVRSWAEKNDAENAVWAASGVNMVENKLKVESPVYAL